MGFSLKKLLRDAGDVVGLDGHIGYQGPQQQNSKPAPASTARPSGPSFAQKVESGIRGIGNTRLKGVEQLMGRNEESVNFNPVTVKDVVRHTPVLEDAVAFASKPQAERGVGDFTKAIFKSGAKNAGYAVPEARIVKVAPEANVVVRATSKLINNAVPAAPASVVGQVAAGERDPASIARKALLDSSINGAVPAGGEVARPAAKAVKAEVKAGFPAVKNEDGYIATPSAVNYPKYKEQGKPETTFPDGSKGVEISDKGMRIKDEGLARMSTGEHVNLGDLVDHKNLEKDYPTFFGGGTGGVRVGFDMSDPTSRAFYNPDTNAIHINPAAFGKDAAGVIKNLKTDNGRKILVHEISHAIDEHSGVPRGGSPEAVRASLQDPGVVEAENTMKAYQDGYDQLKANRDSGLITPEEFATDPHVQAYESALAVTKAGEEPNPADVFRAYQRQPNEQRASMVADRAGMSQREIDKNPLGEQAVPFRLEGAPDNRMADMLPPGEDLSPDEIRQGIADGVLDPKTPTTGLVGPEVKMAINSPHQVKENALTRKGKAGDQNLSPELQSRISGEHEVRSTQQLADEAIAAADKSGLDKTIQDAHNAMNVKDGSITDKDVALAHQAIERADEAGRLEDANAIHDALSNHLRQKGQDIQAATLLYRRSPQGMLYSALKTLKKEGVTVTPEIQKGLQGHIDAIKALPDGPARDFAKAAFGKALAKLIPKGKLDNLVSVWKAGLLSGVKTQGGNFVSNATFGSLKKASDPLAAGVDKVFSLKTGKRTKTATTKGLASGAKEGVDTAKTTLKTGIDLRNNLDKYEQHGEINFNNKVIQKVFGDTANYVFRGMSAADQPFYYSAFKNSLYDQAKADGLNSGLKGKALRDHMNKLAANPTIDMAETAQADAAKSVLGYDTIASKAISGIHKQIDTFPGISDVGRQGAHAVINVLAPFTRVPSAFLSRTVDFTPLGVGKEIISQVSKGKFNQRLMSQAISEGVTGTGLVAIGMTLAHNGQLSGDYPKDAKEQARWKAEGITANSIKVGDKWISLNYMGPVGLLFGMGKRMVDASKGGSSAVGEVGSAIAGLGSGLLGQSFLQGFSGFADAIKDPTQNLATYLKSEASSVVPNIVNDAANVTDSMQRQTNSAFDAIKSKIPFLRETLNPKIDAFGNDLDQPDGPANAAFNPLKPSKDRSTDLTMEIDRLKETSKENFVIPSTEKTIDVGSDTIKLSGDEQYTYNKVRGQEIEKVWNQLIKSPEYQALDDTDKANALRSSMSDVNAVAKAQMLEAMGKTDQAKTVADKLSDNQYRIMTGGALEPIDYVKDRSTDRALGTASSSRTKSTKTAYETAKTKYERGKDKMNDSERLKAEKSLATLKIKGDYDQEVIDFYNLSNADKNALFKSNPDKAKQLYDKAAELSTKLANAGLSSKKVSTSTGRGKGGGGKKGGSKKVTSAAITALSATTKTGQQTTSALRKIVKGSKIKRKAVKK
jgi:hypothetical protein